MTLALHDEIKRVAHAIITEYVRAYPAMPHTDVLAKFCNRLEDQIIELMSKGSEPLQVPVRAKVLPKVLGVSGDDPDAFVVKWPPSNSSD